MQTNCPASRLDVEGCAVRRLPVVVAAGLVVLSIFAAAVVVSDPFGLQGEMRGAESRLTEGFASSGPTPDSGGGTVIATIPVGDYPFGVAYDSGNGYVYVANYNSNNVNGSNTVSVIDGTTIVATIPVGSNPDALAYDSQKGYVYVANYGSGNVSVISGNTVVAWIPVGEYPDSLAYDSGNGCIYVARYYAGTVSVMCTATQLSLLTFTETGLPSGTSWSVTMGGVSNSSTTPTITFSEPNGTHAYAVGRVNGYAAYYDPFPSSGSVVVNGGPKGVTISFRGITAGGIVVATIPVGTYPDGVAYDSGNGYVYVANRASRNVSVISGRIVVATVPVGNGPNGVAYDSGNGYVYVTNAGSTTVSVIFGTTVVATIPVGAYPDGAAYDSVNGYIYVANDGSSNVSVISGTTIAATVPVGNYPSGVGCDSGSGYVYVTTYGSNIVSVINGTTVVATVRVGYQADGVGYDSGNGNVYVANQGSNTVSVISGTTVVATVPVGNGPDGVAYDDGNGYVYVTNSYSNNVSVVSGTNVVATTPVGSYPAGVAYDGGNGYVYVANTGSNTVSVISTIAPPSAPSAPRNLTAVPGVGQVVLTWQTPASDGGAPITNYTVHRGTASGAESILTSMGDVVTYTDTTVTNGFTYYYEVSAVNRFGVGSRSNEVAATPVPLPDSIAPSIRISSPLNNTIVSSTTVVATGTASDNVAVQTVELSTDGTTWIAASGTTTWSGSVTLHAGTNVIYARATDTSGNRATVHIIVTVENAGPGSSGLDPVILATILVAIGAVGFAAGLIVWKRGKPGRPPPGGPTRRADPAHRPTTLPSPMS